MLLKGQEHQPTGEENRRIGCDRIGVLELEESRPKTKEDKVWVLLAF